MDEKIISMGYYWYGYSSDIMETIKKCGICHSEKEGFRILNQPKIIISYGPIKDINATYGICLIH